MATIRPTTRSPGFLVLPYIANGAEHRLALRLLFGVDLSSLVLIGSVANGLAPLVAACMPTTQALNRWEVYDANNSFVGGANLNASYPGTHGGSAGMANYHSAYIQFTGKGTAGAPGLAVGQTRFGFRTGNAYQFQPGQKRMTFTAELSALAQALAISSIVWADFFGQKAVMRAGVTVQFNAHIQRTEGQ